jgi:predicted flap endonuclease-1-like 5' DNA nuclease
MSWLTETQTPSVLRDRALKSLSLPLGLANPLWLAFGAAASAGAAWWLMTSWARPVNLEAMALARTSDVLDIEEAPDVLAIEEAPEVVTETLAVEPVAIEPEPEALVQEVLTAAEAAPLADDDLTQLVGVGPRTAQALAERGVTRFAQLADWTAEQMAAFDADLKLKGRSLRDAWLDQARRLVTAAN